ncbi:hypothetical protein FOMA001_g17535 [Fusarium oxysporum f. sp. matthiolae]|nr:hypothetical protein FOMA001_g17535 [Fusarium oxysporum f. sp. matthiolae]
MLLTIGGIWLATDKATLHSYPILREYNAEVPTEIWQAFLFQSTADMIRLQRLETYLMGRKWTPSKPSVFRSFGDNMSFPVRYFQQSPILQSKKASIEERAELDKQPKISEFNHLKERYNDLMQQYNTTVCQETYQTLLGVRYPIHDPYRPRCSLARRMNNLQIMVHEWPLPTDTLQAQATVFELGIPHQFAKWRDVTFYFIHDVLSFKSFGEQFLISFLAISLIGTIAKQKACHSAGGILAFALGQKRWIVSYEITPHRETGTKLAVPFRVKDSPTPRSEFSHPDVVMTLTCLSYYYGGLDEEALFSAFSILTKSDNARVEYHEWTGTAPNLPLSFRALEGVNLRDRVQFKEETYPHLCFPKSAIDYYLSHLVSSKEAKRFPHKLSVSGGDLAKTTGNPTTGFSGANDSRYVLPMDIKQLDLPG